jgi:HD-like signal output (HDOD) protein
VTGTPTTTAAQTTWSDWLESGAWVAIDDTSIPMLPSLASEVMTLTMDPDVSAIQLARVISKEQVLAVQVLRLANSAYAGARREISTLNEAIVRVGTRAVQSTVLTVCAASRMKEASVHGGDGRALTDHALGTAMLAWLTAEPLGVAADEAMVYGLLHDIGKLALLSLRKSFVDGGGAMPSPEESEAAIREWHPTVGEWLLGRWQLPMVLRQAVLYHHAPQNCQQFPVEARNAYLANRLSHRFGFGCPPTPDDAFLDDPICQELALTSEWLDEVSRRAPGLFATTRNIVV